MRISSNARRRCASTRHSGRSVGFMALEAVVAVKFRNANMGLC
jgi:hypothetical protein